MTTPPIKLIGLVGHKQSGKDTVWSIVSKLDASYLTRCKCFRYAFADALKMEVAEILGVNADNLNAKKNHPLVRHIYQWYGSDYKRAEDKNYWIKHLDFQITQFKQAAVPCINVFVTDVRFLNEAEYIKQSGGILWRIRRRVADEVWDPHPSEVEVDKIECDNFIHNDMSVLRLEKEVIDVMKQHQLLK